ncbi:hypothetical protein [Streptomyces echinatus]|uniref:Uncharacterized protein n=1 Tax=Streptomyces echinatus TaxID=67293 RepID=A0A7W9URZ8_9ACTN|nr:hypothetical protein [Streptomyces echinatus]MBB5929025.1 hypothetical protein [Streptomyces echinatus]
MDAEDRHDTGGDRARERNAAPGPEEKTVPAPEENTVPGREEDTDPARERERRREADELRRRVAALAHEPPRSLREAVHRAARRRTADDTGRDPAAGTRGRPAEPGDPADTP